ncbi:hypothetical protein HMPREF0971_00700 [Segatella oris F0302]|uniref:Uncharacterized protein n=1 Tax=Segatella oris F0302 TaxID=649760 RepID=D1QP10_9BACT|nr:hypothetical protein HMPREF0971_00700 [Segatella oris F0302]EYA29708.1 hypothetical protein M106_1739 [Bacteroides fragilis str. 1009-4-F \
MTNKQDSQNVRQSYNFVFGNRRNVLIMNNLIPYKFIPLEKY